MSKLTLNNVGNLIDATTAATVINDNSAAIVAAMENTLSRDGTTPNQMGSDLDMNSHDILNVNEIQLRDGTTLTQLPTSTIQGSLIQRGANSWEVLNPGPNGSFLASTGPGTSLSWNSSVGVGDMVKSVYDPNNLNASAFDSFRQSQFTRQELITKNIPSTVNYLSTSGYYNSGDYGSAKYKRAVSAPSHQGYFQSADGAYWVLSEAEPKAAQFGVKGDNSAVVGDMNAEVIALNNFFKYLGQPANRDYSTGYLHGCVGNFFRINSSLYLYPNTTIRCPSINATIYAVFDGTVFLPINGATQRTNGVLMHGGLIIDGNSPTNSVTGFGLQNASLWKISNVYIQNVVTGVNIYNNIATPLDGSNYNCFTSCVVDGATSGYILEPNVNSNTFFDCRTNNCTYGLIDRGNDNSAVRCQFENGYTAIWTRAGADNWVTATTYSVGVYVNQGGKFYKCLVAHTSGVFATDLASGYWIKLADSLYYSQNFSSISNRFEGWSNGHVFDPSSVNPTIVSPIYVSVSTPVYNQIATVNNNPVILGVDGVSAGFNGTWFESIRKIQATVSFGAISPNASLDVLYNTGTTDLTVNDIVLIMSSSSAGSGLMFNAVPTSGGFYIRCLNGTTGSITPGSLTFNCLALKVAP